MTAPRPTGEQQDIIDAYQGGAELVIEAGAGTGKTSTLRLLANAQPRRRGLYVAYNKAIASDAKRSFPASVTCATAHSLAFRAVGRRFAHRLNGPRMPARQTAKELGITRPLAIPHVGSTRAPAGRPPGHGNHHPLLPLRRRRHRTLARPQAPAWTTPPRSRSCARR